MDDDQVPIHLQIGIKCDNVHTLVISFAILWKTLQFLVIFFYKNRTNKKKRRIITEDAHCNQEDGEGGEKDTGCLRRPNQLAKDLL